MKSVFFAARAWITLVLPPGTTNTSKEERSSLASSRDIYRLKCRCQHPSGKMWPLEDWGFLNCKSQFSDAKVNFNAPAMTHWKADR